MAIEIPVVMNGTIGGVRMTEVEFDVSSSLCS